MECPLHKTSGKAHSHSGSVQKYNPLSSIFHIHGLFVLNRGHVVDITGDSMRSRSRMSSPTYSTVKLLAGHTRAFPDNQYIALEDINPSRLYERKSILAIVPTKFYDERKRKRKKKKIREPSIDLGSSLSRVLQTALPKAFG